MSAIVVVRHGDTFAPGEAPRRIGARTDPPLAENGREQARRLRAWFDAAGFTFGSAWASDLRRTRDTLAILTSGTGTPVTAAEWLREIDHGADEDRPEAEVRARLGEAAIAAWDRDAVPPDGWHVGVAARIASWRAFLDERRGQDGTDLLVTSNGAARFALLASRDLAEQARALPSLRLRTGAWGRLHWSGERWMIDCWDERPPAVPSPAPLGGDMGVETVCDP